MPGLSDYNREKFLGLQTDHRESRLRKAAAMILREPAGRLLDIGCGNASFSAGFLRAGFAVAGIDMTEEQIAAARARGIDARVHDLGSGPLPFPDRSFDVAFAGEVIEHIVDTTAFLSEIHRVLKPNGCVVLTTPNLASAENRLRLLFGFYPIWTEFRLEGGQGHVRSYTRRTLVRHLRETGFAVEAVTGNWVPIVPQKFADDIRHPFLAPTGDWFPGLAMDLIVKARKPARP
jgi:2-polyprenyl-3-methyl-5-hydroxy-6-metoxy-1,4-benzoquinol methylase